MFIYLYICCFMYKYIYIYIHTHTYVFSIIKQAMVLGFETSNLKLCELKLRELTVPDGSRPRRRI